jgi:hypothetical protein
MRLFSGSTPKTSPELVRHSLVSKPGGGGGGERGGRGHNNVSVAAAAVSSSSSSHDPMPSTTPPREHSPALVRGVSTLGRKFSRRFEKFGESETARRLRMASPSRKYQWAITGDIATNGSELQQQQQQQQQQHHAEAQQKQQQTEKKRVSRVDSFRNFFSLVHAPSPSSTPSSNKAGSNHTTSTLRTPRAVKRRSRNGGEKRSSRLQLVDAETSTPAHQHNLSAPSSLSTGLNSRFGSSSTELALIMSGSTAVVDSELALSECQSEADLRYYNYCTTEEEEDDNSVASEGFLRSTLVRNGNSKSAGNLRLGILPENRTINFQDKSLQIKDYGMIDSSNQSNGGGGNVNAAVAPTTNGEKKAPSQNSHESGYSSSDNNSGTSPNSSSRASPRASIDGEQEIGKEATAAAESSPVSLVTAKLLRPSSSSVPPKKPARLSKMGAASPHNSQSRSRSLDPSQNDDPLLNGIQQQAQPMAAAPKTVKDYKMVRLVKRVPGDELGIIIAKKKLKEINTTGFQIVHIEPDGMVDR